jgi:hypothetical protein
MAKNGMFIELIVQMMAKVYYENGKVHRLVHPARIYENENLEWFKDN